MTGRPPRAADRTAGESRAEKRAWWLAAIVAGLGYALLTCGWRVFDPTYLGWPAGDPATAFLGWSFLRVEPGWHFPPTWVTRLGYPVGVSASYTDMIPLVALPLSLLDRVLPRDFQYFGLVIGTNSVLQAWFGLRIARRLAGPDRPLATLGGGLLLLMAPVLWIRFYGHFALSAQWLLLAAILLYLRVGEAPRRRLVALGLLLLWLAGGTSPYLLAMVALILAAAWWRASLLRALSAGRAVLLLPVGLAVAVASLLFHGFLVLPLQVGDFDSGGYRDLGTSLSGLVDPLGYSALMPWAALSSAPWESLGYLGLGALLLLLGALPLVAARTGDWRAWVPLAAAVLLAFVFALTDVVRLGDRVLFSFALPPGWDQLARSFHASGRFVWPIHYALLVLALAGVLGWQRPRLAAAVLLIAAVVQFVDLAPLRAAVRETYQDFERSLPPNQAWDHLAIDHDHLVEVMPWQCVYGPIGTYWLLGRLAQQQGLTINTVYLARMTAEAKRVHCRELPQTLLRDGLDGRSAYVFSPDSARLLALLAAPRQSCREVGSFVLCRMVPDRDGLAAALVTRLFDNLPADARPVRLSGSRYIVEAGQPWGIAFRVAGDATAGLTLTVRCPPSAGAFPQGPLRLMLSGKPSGEIVPMSLSATAWRLPLGELPASALVGVALPEPWEPLPSCRIALDRAPP